MAERRTCDECGAELAANAPLGLCPRCLVGMGLLLAPSDQGKALSAPGENIGDWVGCYQLREKLGEGGCGVVYLAEQAEPIRRQVALKVIKLGMDTQSVIARFEAERQALSLMDHPQIAKLLDGGATESGRPFFVMELVRGAKITDYSDAHQLPIPERLGLFIQACRAVQHAHQKGIIHRDIKPSNILVSVLDGVAVPKVIDFGIAKAITDQRLTDKTIFTAVEQLMGTPAYMSPEQAGSGVLDIDTRSDIYSLGVLLYELLAGRPPFEADARSPGGLEALRREIQEREPVRPSARLKMLAGDEMIEVAKRRRTQPVRLVKLVRGDLDWIVMKALEKDRARRYETANGLAMEVQRYLAHEPVVAGPPDKLYRFRKLVRRNRLVFLGAGTVTLVLVLGTAVAIGLFLEQRRALIRANTAEQEQARLLRQLAAEVETAKTEVTAGHRAATLARVRANWWLNAQQGRWPAAAADLARVLELDPADADEWFTLGALLVESGNVAGYREHRRAVLKRFGTNEDQTIALKAARACLLMPSEGTEPETISHLTDLGVSGAPKDPWAELVKGLAEYRRNRLASAVSSVNQILAREDLDNVTEVAARAVLAMACFQLKQTNEATVALRQANDVALKASELKPINLPRAEASRPLTAVILQREAQSLNQKE